MLKIDGTTIYLTRGDTALIQIALTDPDGNAYTPAPTDTIRFAMKQRMSDSIAVLYETDIDPTTLLLSIPSSATENMTYSKVRPYKYDIELTASGYVDTFIADADIYILPEVDVNGDN